MRNLLIVLLFSISTHLFAVENQCRWDISLSCNGESISRSCDLFCSEGRESFGTYEVLTGVACQEMSCDDEVINEGLCACIYEKQD